MTRTTDKDQPPCPVPKDPVPGQFFDPVPIDPDDPTPQICSLGPALLELGRLKPRKYRLLRQVGYCDPKTGVSWVYPRHLDRWTCDLASTPTVFNWILPIRGSHFPAFILHDAHVEEKAFDPAAVGAQGEDYVGEKVSREEADRITRDAMYELGTSFPRRWTAWAGMMAATVAKGGLGGGANVLVHRLLLALTVVTSVAFGAIHLGAIFGWWTGFPWIHGLAWWGRAGYSALGTAVVALLIAVPWGPRWQFGFTSAFLLPIVLTASIPIFALTAAQKTFNWILRLLQANRETPAELRPLAFGRRQGLDAVWGKVWYRSA